MTNKPISEVIRDMREHADYIIEMKNEFPEGHDDLLHAYDRADTLFGAENVNRLIDRIAAIEHTSSVNWEAAAPLNVENEENKRKVAELEQQLAAERARVVKLPKELRDIGNNIRTQDNRITDQPFFAVMAKREIVASEDHDCDRICWVENQSGDYVEATETQHRRLEAIYQSRCEVREGWDRYAVKEIDVFVTGCFTELGCKDYIRKNGHNLNKPFIYAFGSYRNDEYQAVRNFLASLPVEGE